MRRAPKLFVERLECREVPATLTSLALSNYTGAVPWGQLRNGSTNAKAYSAPSTLSDRSTFQFTGDFNGDGTNDVATFTNESTWEISLSRRDGFTSAAWAMDWGNSEGWQQLGVGDFNRDGYTDVLGIDWGGRWHVGLSNGFLFRKRIWASGSSKFWSSIHLGDFNGDGRSDVMALDYVGQWKFFESAGNRFIARSTGVDWVSPTYWTTIEVGDFNADGKADLAGLRFKKTWHVILGGKNFKSTVWATDWPINQTWREFVVADVDLDGDTDIFGLTSLGVWYTGRVEKSAFRVLPYSSAMKNVTQQWRTIETADLTGDGRPDFVHWHSNGSFYVLITNAKWAFRKAWTAPSATTNAKRMLLRDVNGDGLADVVLTTLQGTLYTGLSSGSRFYFGLTSASTFFYIAPWDLAAVRAKPASIATIFQRYLPGLKRRMARLAPGMSQEMLAAIFTSIFAYEYASYRSVGDPLRAPKVRELASLLATPRLVCTEYDYFAHHLYRLIYPKPKVDPMTISIVGWNEGLFGNHSQIIASDGNDSWLLDPTVGIIARTDLDSLLGGIPVPSTAIVEFARRVEATDYLESVMTRFRANIQFALVAGAFPQSKSLYEYRIDTVLRYRYKP